MGGSVFDIDLITSDRLDPRRAEALRRLIRLRVAAEKRAVLIPLLTDAIEQLNIGTVWKLASFIDHAGLVDVLDYAQGKVQLTSTEIDKAQAKRIVKIIAAAADAKDDKQRAAALRRVELRKGEYHVALKDDYVAEQLQQAEQTAYIALLSDVLTQPAHLPRIKFLFDTLSRGSKTVEAMKDHIDGNIKYFAVGCLDVHGKKKGNSIPGPDRQAMLTFLRQAEHCANARIPVREKLAGISRGKTTSLPAAQAA